MEIIVKICVITVSLNKINDKKETDTRTRTQMSNYVNHYVYITHQKLYDLVHIATEININENRSSLAASAPLNGKF